MWSAVTLSLTLMVPSSTYDSARARLEAERVELGSEFRKARTQVAKQKVIRRARVVLLESLTEEIVPAWLGTPWTMGGRSKIPKEGTIACGTFVGTVLHHSGFRLNRIRLGRLASEHIALSLTHNRNLRRYRNRPAQEVVDDVQRWGYGLYAVGLDTHAGLIFVNKAGKARFIHSSFYGAGTVVDEPLAGDNPFDFSRYRVVAKLLDDTMMKKWLLGRRFVARKGRG